MNIPATVVCWLRQGASARNGQIAFGGLSVLKEQIARPIAKAPAEIDTTRLFGIGDHRIMLLAGNRA